MPNSFQSLSITDQDRDKFPDLFKTRKQQNSQSKSEIGKNVRNQLKIFKQSYIEEKIKKEKELIRQRYEFEELLEKFQKFRRADEELPSPNIKYHAAKSKIWFFTQSVQIGFSFHSISSFFKINLYKFLAQKTILK